MEWSFDDVARRAGAPCCVSLRSLVAVTVIGLTVLLSPPVAAQSADLFTPVDATSPSGPSEEGVLRSRIVTIDFAQLDHAQAAGAASSGPTTQTRDTSSRPDKRSTTPAPGTTLTLNLFNDTIVTGMVERTAPTFSGGYSVAGHLVEEPLGTMTLVVNGATVAGTVRWPGEVYEIRSVGDGLYAVSEVEEPPLDCVVDEFHAETDHQH